MIPSSLPPESVMARIRREYRDKCEAESAQETALQIGNWRDTAALMWGDLTAGLLALHEAPTALRIEGTV